MKKALATIVMVLAIFMVANVSQAGSVTQTIEYITSGSKYNAAYVCNCVDYARWLTGGKLPTGLTTLSGKLKIINTSTPKEGRVAIMAVGPYGHVGYVSSVDDSGKNLSITIYEANYKTCKITKRTIKGTNCKMSDLEKYASIKGYWKK
jgi:hypothetical protein